jgi:hypothetical protein
MKTGRVLTLSAAALGVALSVSAQGWPQWGQNPQHTSEVSVPGQPARTVLADIVYDPFVEQEMADPLGGSQLLVHYQVPLLSGEDVFMAFKSGTYTSLDHWETQTWNERRLHWEHGALVPKWNFASDWKPAPYSFGITGARIEPVFHAALAGGFVYVPGFGGTVFKLARHNGEVVARINPFGSSLDPDIFLSGPLAADDAGNIYYHASKFVHGAAWFADVIDSWLVRIAPDGQARTVSYATLNPGAPQGDDLCPWVFPASQLPWPPSPDAVPPSVPCGSQRPGLNSGLGIAPDGTIYTVTLAHFVDRSPYLLAVNPDLTPKWAASLRERFHDGCNGIIPPTGTLGGCRAGARDGVDPSENRPGTGRVLDNATSTPVVLPDGSILYGSYSRYNYAQGHLMKFSSTGQFLGAYPYGWDLTPSVWSHDGTYSIILKDNHYGEGGAYCNDPAICPWDRDVLSPGYPEAFFITQLSPDLVPEWQYQSTNTESCTRQPNGAITCVSDHPHGFEWCINGAAVDAQGVVYANNEDGGLYTIRQGGTVKDHIFLNSAIGGAYTPLSIGPDGKIYAQNEGHLIVVGR